MTKTAAHPLSAGLPIDVRQATPDLFHAAACRLVSQATHNVESAATRLVESAPGHGIDLSLCWITLDPAATSRRPRVRQACLAVLGSGKTAMLFMSEPPTGGDHDAAQALKERAACADAACQWLAQHRRNDVHLAQALPDPGDAWNRAALDTAGFFMVGNLTYLRREARPLPAEQPKPLPAGITLESFHAYPKDQAQRLLIHALDRTYEQTLDCPELCGLRDTKDVLESHRATGRIDPTLWTLVLKEGEALGCCLLNPCPEQASVELVYLGLAPQVRGAGLARRLLRDGIVRCQAIHPTWSTTCAVDERNVPARTLYDRLGFRAFGHRVAMVRPLRKSAHSGS